MQTFPDNSTCFSNKEGDGNEKEKKQQCCAKNRCCESPRVTSP